MQMKNISIIAFCIFLFIGCKDRQSISLSNYLNGDYQVYRVDDTTYFDVSTVLQFESHWGEFSPNIFDFDGSGIVDTYDRLKVIEGWGKVYEEEWNIEYAQVNGQFSSGWILDLEGWEVCFLKVTAYDETGFIPDTLNTFFLEGVIQGQQTKVWYTRID